MHCTYENKLFNAIAGKPPFKYKFSPFWTLLNFSFIFDGTINENGEKNISAIKWDVMHMFAGGNTQHWLDS